MRFQALFGDAKSLIVQVGLLGHVPYLGDEHRPEDQQGDRRGDGLLAEDPYPRIYPGPVGYGLYLYVQCGFKSYDGLEGPSAADAGARPSRAALLAHHQHGAVSVPDNRVRDAAHQGSPDTTQAPAAHHYQSCPYLFG